MSHLMRWQIIRQLQRAETENIRLGRRLHESERERAEVRSLLSRFVVSMDPIPLEDLERAREYVKERGWVPDR